MIKTNADRIREFHQAIGTLPSAPVIPDLQTLLLRRKLIEEEYHEVTAVFDHLITTQPAPETAELVPLVHELADLLYVTYGAMVACGVDPDAVFAELHRANMQRVNAPRRADGKILKPADWKPANITAVLDKQKELSER